MNGCGRHVRVLVNVLLALCVSCLFIVHRLSEEASLAILASDKAFDNGELKRAMEEARYASMASIPESGHQKRSIERLSAIAAGAEATGRPHTALLAWSTLSATSAATTNVPLVRAPLEPQSEQHMTYLLDKISGASASGTARTESHIRTSIRLLNQRSCISAALLVVAPILGLMGLAIRIRVAQARGHFSQSAAIRAISLYLVAASFWCIGWVIA